MKPMSVRNLAYYLGNALEERYLRNTAPNFLLPLESYSSKVEF